MMILSFKNKKEGLNSLNKIRDFYLNELEILNEKRIKLLMEEDRVEEEEEIGEEEYRILKEKWEELLKGYELEKEKYLGYINLSLEYKVKVDLGFCDCGSCWDCVVSELEDDMGEGENKRFKIEYL